MPNFPWPRRRDEPASADASLAALWSGTLPPDDLPPELRPAADVLAALRAAAGPDELGGEQAALAEFRSQARRRPARRRAPVPALSGRIAMAALVLAVGIGGVAAATIGGGLPRSLSRGIFSRGQHDSTPSQPMRGGAREQVRSARRSPGHGPATPPLCAAYQRAAASGHQALARRIHRRLTQAAPCPSAPGLARRPRPGRLPIFPPRTRWISGVHGGPRPFPRGLGPPPLRAAGTASAGHRPGPRGASRRPVRPGRG